MTTPSDGDRLARAATQFREAFHRVFHASTEYPHLAELWTLLGAELAAWDAGAPLREAEREYVDASLAASEHLCQMELVQEEASFDSMAMRQSDLDHKRVEALEKLMLLAARAAAGGQP